MLLFGITVANTACDDWTDMEPKFQEDMTQSSLPEEYYAQLRAYKKTDHPVAFGWFGNWTGNGATLEKDECYGCAYGKCGPCIGICYKSMKA